MSEALSSKDAFSISGEAASGTPGQVLSSDTGNGFARRAVTHVRDGKMPVHEGDLEDLLRYLQRVRNKAERIRDNAPSGSYLAEVLTRTLDGLVSEIGQLRHLLGLRDRPTPAEALKDEPAPTITAQRRMRPVS